MPDGTTFDKLDGQGRPVDGFDKDHRHFAVSYDGAGNASWKFDNGDVLVYDPNGKPVREVTPDGTTFTSFDDKGRPTEGYTAAGIHFKLTYDDKGDVFEHLGDGTVIETDPNGKPLKMWPPNGPMIDFAVDIPALHDAIGKVRTERDYISDRLQDLKRISTDVAEMWDSPAGKSFPPVVDAFSTSAYTFVALLDDAISRMGRAYDNYGSTEKTNVANLSLTHRSARFSAE